MSWSFKSTSTVCTCTAGATRTIFIGNGRAVQSIIGPVERSTEENCAPRRLWLRGPEVWSVVSWGPVAILA